MRTFGTATFVKGQWHLKVEPHIAIRLKRVFGKVDKYQQGVAWLSDTVENARDLQWFCERYPLVVEPLEYLNARAQLHRDQSELLGKMLTDTYVPTAFELAIPARAYQRQAADIALAAGGLLLADDVGTGKTISAICMLTDPRARPALVVTLAHLPTQWAREIQRFAPGLKVHIVKSSTPYDLNQRQRGRQLGFREQTPDVIIMSYHKLASWVEILAPMVKSVIYDECQELRHAGKERDVPKKCMAAKHLAAKTDYRLGLSATPIYNFGSEFHAVIECLRPGGMGTLQEFNREWCKAGGIVSKPKALGAYLREQCFMLRRTRKDIGRELPALIKIPHYVNADTKVLDALTDRAAELARIVLGQNERFKGEKFQAAKDLDWLVRRETGVAKAPFVADFVRLLVESGERVVLYGWHREVYGIWLERLKDLSRDGHGPAMYTGSESTQQKEKQKARFMNGDTPVLIISLRSGAGLDGLQNSCRTVVFGELDWSPAVHAQCVGRVYRDGQPDPVAAYFLIADSGSDPVVADVLNLKREQIEGAIDPYADLVEELQVDPDHVKRLAESVLRRRGGEKQEEKAA